MQKKRLDVLVHELYPQWSRRQIQDWIEDGKVTVDGKVACKPGRQFYNQSSIFLDAENPKYVSRAGYKLEKALDHFKVCVQGLTALDAGISTGGFTDCLLQRGARKVYGIEVGSGQTHPKIALDSRVHIKENTNLRYLQSVGEYIDIMTLDLSFISVLKVMPAVSLLLGKGSLLVVLIKPQFETSRECIGKRGIVKDACVHNFVVKQVIEEIVGYGFASHGHIQSPIVGGDGNIEFLACFHKVV